MPIPIHQIKQEPQPLKPESTSVIKSTASPLKFGTDSIDNRTREPGAKMPPDITKSVAPGKEIHIKQEPGVKGGDVSRLTRPPSSLSINSPLQVATDSRDHSGDVRSPAYSDISDDSAPTLENETQVKPKEDEKARGGDGKAGEQSSEHSMASSYGMYHSYYGQPPYLIPAVTPSSSQSGSQASDSRQSTPKPVEAEADAKPDNMPRKEVKEATHRDKERPKEDGAKNGSMSEYQLQQQKLMQPQMYQQYNQYYAGYGMDPHYHMHMMANDPNYRQQFEEHEKRRQEAEAKKGGDKGGGDADKKSEGRSVDGGSHTKVLPSGPPKAHEQSRSDKHSPSSKPPALISEKERKMREMERAERVEASLKEKQNETHQILKENHELKNQMDSRNYERMLAERQQEELRRYYMYQQQMVHPNTHRQQAQEDDRRRYYKPADYPSPGQQKAAEGAPQPKKDKMSSKDGAKGDGDRHRDGSRSRDSSEARKEGEKRMEKFKEVEEKCRASPSSRGTPTKSGASTPTSMPASYAQYFSPAYIQQQSPHYAGVPFDPNHPMYRGVSPFIGYAASPTQAYLHPSQIPQQMRYHVSVEGEKGMLVSPTGQPPPQEHSGKAMEMLQQHASHYHSPNSNAHKIHELQELGKSRDANASPAKSSSTSSPVPEQQRERETRPDAKSREYPREGRSPPPQRHLHTHHHTHVMGTAGYPIYDPYGGM